MVYVLLLTFVIGFISGRLVGSFSSQRVAEREEPEKIPLVPVIIVSAFSVSFLDYFFKGRHAEETSEDTEHTILGLGAEKI